MDAVDWAINDVDFEFMVPLRVCREQSGEQSMVNPLACSIMMMVVMAYKVFRLA